MNDNKKGWVPVSIWQNVFWFIRNAGAAFRMGWEQAAPVVTRIK